MKEYLEMAGQIPVTRGGHVFQETERYFLLADLAVLERDETALRQYIPIAEEMAIRDRHRLFQAGIHRAWGVLYRLTGEYVQAETRLLQALELFEEMETRWQIGRTLYELGELAQAQTELVSARDYFSHALASFEEMNAVPDMAQTRAALVSLD